MKSLTTTTTLIALVASGAMLLAAVAYTYAFNQLSPSNEVASAEVTSQCYLEPGSAAATALKQQLDGDEKIMVSGCGGLF